MSDSNKVKDGIHVGLETEVVPPAFPCETCGVETKDIHLLGWRYCSDCDKRVYLGLTEEQLLGLMEDLKGAQARVKTFEVMYKQADKELTDALRTMRDRGII